MKKGYMRKYFLVCSAVMAVWCLPFTVGCKRPDDSAGTVSERVRPVKVLRLENPSLEYSRSFPGTADAAREVDLSFRVSGPLIQFNLETGQAVSREEILARIDPRDFEVRVKTLTARLNASGAKKKEAWLQFERYRSLIKEKGVAKARFDTAKAAWEMAEAQVEADMENLEDARNALTDTVLKAPFSGFLHEVYVENHETVQAGKPVVSLVDLSTIEVAVGIPEDFLRKVADITSFSCTFDAFPDETFEASLKEVGKRPNPSNQTYPMILILGKGFEDRGMLIRPGMTGEVTVAICDKGKDKAFTVPLEAVVNNGNRRSFVWIFEPAGECVKRRYVNTLKFMNQGIEITGDIRPGDLVVTAGAQYLEDNQKVRILEPPAETNAGNLL